MAFKIDASVFGQPLGMLRNLGQFAPQLFGQSFQPDLSGADAISKAFASMPMMNMGGGRTFDSSLLATPGETMNTAAAGAIPQQAGLWANNQDWLSNFLLGTASTRDQIMAMLTNLRAAQERANTQSTGGILGALF